jgi:RNA polymerase sigma-70 factor (ECF subfamily)
MVMIQAGRHCGLQLLYDRYGPFLKCLGMKALRSESDAEDLLQDVFLEIWQRATSYNSLKGRPLSWIITLTRRRSIDRFRRRETHHRCEERFAQEQEDLAGTWTHVHEDLALAEMNTHVQRALAALPEAQRKAVCFAYHKQMSHREIAKHTGIPLGTIKTRLELGLRKMASSLSGLEDLLCANRSKQYAMPTVTRSNQCKSPLRTLMLTPQAAGPASIRGSIAAPKKIQTVVKPRSNHDSIMKTLATCCFATAAFLSFSACTTVEDRHEPSMRGTTTTTTEESTIRHPVGSTTETRTTHSY